MLKNQSTSKERKYLPTFAEKIDRLVICQLKEFLIPEYREEYSKEIAEIIHDIDLDIEEKEITLDAKNIRDIIILAIINREIWLTEGNYRKGIKEGNDLAKSHGLNKVRNISKNRIQEKIGGRKDLKIDVVETYPEWIPSWENKQ